MINLPSHALQTQRGSPSPLGATKKEGGLNFALFSKNATAMTLHLFLPQGKNPFASFILNPESNKTGWVWHILVEGIDAKQIEYSYQVFGDNTDPRNLFNPNKILSDPYARGLNTTSTFTSFISL